MKLEGEESTLPNWQKWVNSLGRLGTIQLGEKSKDN